MVWSLDRGRDPRRPGRRRRIGGRRQLRREPLALQPLLGRVQPLHHFGQRALEVAELDRQRFLDLARWAFRSERGAFTITNKSFAPSEAAFIPSCHHEFADQTLVSSALATAAVDTGIVGLKWARVRAVLKTLGGQAAGESIRVTMQAGTSTAVTAPENIGSQTKVMEGAGAEADDATLTFDFPCWSQNGFQSYKLVFTSSGSARTPVLDAMVDCA